MRLIRGRNQYISHLNHSFCRESDAKMSAVGNMEVFSQINKPWILFVKARLLKIVTTQHIY